MDPDEDQIYYLWSWGDGNISNWEGPYNSGEIVNASHTWSQKGTYLIKVKAKDQFEESEWSDSTTINIMKSRQHNYIFNSRLSGLIQYLLTIYRHLFL
jgi:hypothetical protein